MRPFGFSAQQIEVFRRAAAAEPVLFWHRLSHKIDCQVSRCLQEHGQARAEMVRESLALETAKLRLALTREQVQRDAALDTMRMSAIHRFMSALPKEDLGGFR